MSGSRVDALPFSAGHLIRVCGIDKIVSPTLKDALRQIQGHVYPLEDARARKACGTTSRIG